MNKPGLFKMNLWMLAAIVACIAVLLRFLLTPITRVFFEQWGTYCGTAAVAGVLAGVASFGLSLAVVKISRWILGEPPSDQRTATTSFYPGRWLSARVARRFSSLTPRMARLVIGLTWSALLSLFLYGFYEWVTGGFLRELVNQRLDRTLGSLLPENFGPRSKEWLYYNLFCNILGTFIVFVSFAVFAVDPNMAARHPGHFLKGIGFLFAWFPRLAYGPSPSWLRIILAWIIADLSVPIAHLIVSLSWNDEDFSDPSGTILIVLLGCLVFALSILLRGVYDLSRSMLSNQHALWISGLLGYLYCFLFFRYSAHL